MKAFHNNDQIKADILTQLRAHAAADQIVKGRYWQDGKGCAIGCTLHSDNHNEYETRFGIPVALAWLEDSLFEALPNPRAMTWPVEFMESIPVGADLRLVVAKFMHWLLVDPMHGVLRVADAKGQVAIQRVANLYERQLNGEAVTVEEWRAAARAARAAAYAVHAVHAVHAAYVAYAAAYAAYADHATYAAYAADAAARVAQADKLLDLLRHAPCEQMFTVQE